MLLRSALALSPLACCEAGHDYIHAQECTAMLTAQAGFFKTTQYGFGRTVPFFCQQHRVTNVGQLKKSLLFQYPQIEMRIDL